MCTLECEKCQYLCKHNATDAEIEKLWDEFEDVLFVEDEDSGDSCRLVLASNWQRWDSGTTRDAIWEWFNEHYSKGLYELLW